MSLPQSVGCPGAGHHSVLACTPPPLNSSQFHPTSSPPRRLLRPSHQPYFFPGTLYPPDRSMPLFRFFCTPPDRKFRCSAAMCKPPGSAFASVVPYVGWRGLSQPLKIPNGTKPQGVRRTCCPVRLPRPKLPNPLPDSAAHALLAKDPLSNSGRAKPLILCPPASGRQPPTAGSLVSLQQHAAKVAGGGRVSRHTCGAAGSKPVALSQGRRLAGAMVGGPKAPSCCASRRAGPG
jgi:hypothetical protein